MTIIKIDKTQAELVCELFDQYRVFYVQESDVDRAKEFIQKRLDNNESAIFVALEGNKSIGFTQLYPKYSSIRTKKSWILNDLYVAKTHRKKGVGENLIRVAMDYARQDGASTVELSTAIDNYTAQSLYERIGFKKAAPETGFLNYSISLIG